MEALIVDLGDCKQGAQQDPSKLGLEIRSQPAIRGLIGALD
jgi:hypothetical protein